MIAGQYNEAAEAYVMLSGEYSFTITSQASLYTAVCCSVHCVVICHLANVSIQYRCRKINILCDVYAYRQNSDFVLWNALYWQGTVAWLLSYAQHRKPEYSRKVTNLCNSNSYSSMVVLNQTHKIWCIKIALDLLHAPYY